MNKPLPHHTLLNHPIMFPFTNACPAVFTIGWPELAFRIRCLRAQAETHRRRVGSSGARYATGYRRC